MTIIAVKKCCVKNGKEYGPYPEDPDAYYLYRVYREGDGLSKNIWARVPNLTGTSAKYFADVAPKKRRKPLTPEQRESRRARPIGIGEEVEEEKSDIGLSRLP